MSRRAAEGRAVKPTSYIISVPTIHAPATDRAAHQRGRAESRPHNLHHQLIWLLQLEPLHRSGSEVLIAHGSKLSWEQRTASTLPLPTVARVWRVVALLASAAHTRGANAEYFTARLPRAKAATRCCCTWTTTCGRNHAPGADRRRCRRARLPRTLTRAVWAERREGLWCGEGTNEPRRRPIGRDCAHKSGRYICEANERYLSVFNDTTDRRSSTRGNGRTSHARRWHG